MRQQKNEGGLGSIFFIGGILLGIILLLFLWGSALLSEVGNDREFDKEKAENERIERENEELEKKLLKIATPQSKDKWAKLQGSKQPEEEVIILEDEEVGNSEEVRNLSEEEILRRLPPKEQWKIFFFGER